MRIRYSHWFSPETALTTANWFYTHSIAGAYCENNNIVESHYFIICGFVFFVHVNTGRMF